MRYSYESIRNTFRQVKLSGGGLSYYKSSNRLKTVGELWFYQDLSAVA